MADADNIDYVFECRDCGSTYFFTNGPARKILYCPNCHHADHYLGYPCCPTSKEAAETLSWDKVCPICDTPLKRWDEEPPVGLHCRKCDGILRLVETRQWEDIATEMKKLSK